MRMLLVSKWHSTEVVSHSHADLTYSRERRHALLVVLHGTSYRNRQYLHP